MDLIYEKFHGQQNNKNTQNENTHTNHRAVLPTGDQRWIRHSMRNRWPDQQIVNRIGVGQENSASKTSTAKTSASAK
jgi:hypothetical protein